MEKMHGSGAFKNRLREMGFIKGRKLDIVRYAPLHDPLEIKINDSCVSLRVEEADKIEVSIFDR
jgi:ferrous iron transport protein B